MKQFVKRYLNEIVSLAVLVMMVVAFIDGQVMNEKVPEASAPAAKIVMEQIRQ